ncbi:uncharacterized protein BO96DRAFT_482621 [Aspergillus niger CBS 101883]|uniref:uncharacterized protein n=1 Tax=Aspergillus lacticoffeatus (strain CBS 101883) TaxID=1450533 RepID=UPI000D7F41BB|nr:uncharacterized protein BO96DRAFT_482621 [Aspergillus niger CBS 101883]PYH53058.1 hypothetical protein BO96DRAFT_482621 [Aspergillus niger CBS 101883]
MDPGHLAGRVIFPRPNGGSGDGSRTARVYPSGWERGKVKATRRRLVPLFHVGLSPKGKRYVRAALRGDEEGGRGLMWLSRINRLEELPSEILAFAPPPVCNPPCVGATAEGPGTRSSGNDEGVTASGGYIWNKTHAEIDSDGALNAGRGGRSTPYGIMECREKGAPLKHLKQWHELLEPYWRRWLTLGRPSILFCIRALCECGRQRDRTSCHALGEAGSDREVAISKSTGRLAWVACEPDDWLPGLDNALRGAKGSRRGGGASSKSKGFSQLSVSAAVRVTGYYGRTQIAMNRFPVLSKSCYGSLMNTLRFASAAPLSLLMDCCPSVAAGDSLVETNRLALMDASRPR